MSATNAFETDLLSLIFQNASAANVGDATGLRGSTVAGVFYVSLHTANPGETGTQATSEATYTSYARESVNRASGAGGWTVTGNTVDNTSAIVFPEATGGSNTLTHFGLGSAASSTGNLFIYGSLTASLNVSNGITPQFEAGALDVSLD